MGTQYAQLCDTERKAIGRLHAAGQSHRQIAATLVRAPSTISRELRRNSLPSRPWPAGCYSADRAIELTQRRRRRGRGHKLARQPALRRLVRDRRARRGSEHSGRVPVGDVAQRREPLLDVEHRGTLGPLGERQGRQVGAYR